MQRYVIKRRLAEDGQTMDFPVLNEEGSEKPTFRARYNVHTKPQREYNFGDNLIYLAVPSGTTLEFGEREIPIPFKQEGNNKDIKRFKVSPFFLTTDGFTLAKIHPKTPYRMKAKDGTPYHSFEMMETPKSYRSPDEMAFDFVYADEQNGLAAIERGSRIIKFPGVVLFSENSTCRIPGWLAKEFNGSPEFGFAYCPYKEPKKDGELLHFHQAVMEPYLGTEGNVPLFVAMEDGSEKLDVTDQEGIKKTYRGEILQIRKGDVLIPLPKIPHKLLIDDMTPFSFKLYIINYASKNLNEVPENDRVVLEE
ncbi:MAG: hypothetical protein V1802_03265 [Candidatus Aenigmatarchaeota archaeon]